MSASDRQVADRIITALRAEDLLSDETLARISQRLADGTMTADDWVHEVQQDLSTLPANADY
jgi:hypothetical protein